MEGDKTIVPVYHPLSITSAIHKVSESIIKDHFISYLLDNDLICVQQSGFRQGRSISLQLLYVLNDLMEGDKTIFQITIHSV